MAMSSCLPPPCISFSSVANIKYMEKSSFSEKVFIVAHNLRVQYFMTEESRQREIESVSHTVSVIRKQREMNACG